MKMIEEKMIEDTKKNSHRETSGCSFLDTLYRYSGKEK